MRFGLGVNVYETVSEVVSKSLEAERLGFDCIWVSDVPEQRYAPVVASAIAANTKRIKVGVGVLSPLLHTPVQIAASIITLTEAYGERFELCIGPRDRLQLERVGVYFNYFKDIPHVHLKAKNKIEKTLVKEKVHCPIWVAAQGPRMLKISRFFDGVLLNYAHPDLVSWAIQKIGSIKSSAFQIGLYSPSYVYQKMNSHLRTLLRFTSAVVAIGAHKTTLERLGLHEEIADVQTRMREGADISSLIDRIPLKTVELFSIFKSSRELASYLTKLSKMNVAHIVFAYPQNRSSETIRDIAGALRFQETRKADARIK